MSNVVLHQDRHGFPCIVFDCVTGKSYGYVNANCFKTGEQVEDLSVQCDIPVRNMAFYNFNTGLLSSYSFVEKVPDVVLQHMILR